MINRDPRCVFVANNVVQAELTASYLGEHGVPAEVMNLSTLGGLDGLTPWSSTGVAARGIEVWVQKSEDADKARELVKQHEEKRDARKSERNKDGSLTALCEDCGQTSEFPVSQRGTVESCPHCGNYMDVEPDDEESDLDYGTEDEPEEEADPDQPDTRIEPA